MALANRMAAELRRLDRDPPPGVSAWPDGDSITEWKASLKGPKGTVYEAGFFRLSMTIPDRYPFEPPKVKFDTPVYHPNIDLQGRICLNILNMPPKGAWCPALNLSAVLLSLGQLLAEPNPDDGLVLEVTDEYRYRREVFDHKARQWTEKYALGTDASMPSLDTAAASGSTAPSSSAAVTTVSREVGTEADGPNHPQSITIPSNQQRVTENAPDTENNMQVDNAGLQTHKGAVQVAEAAVKRELQASSKLSLKKPKLGL